MRGAVLRAALVTPLSGPLAGFGQAGAAGLSLWAEHALDLSPRWRSVDLDVVDAHPFPAAAMQTATTARPDVVFGPYGSGPAVAAIAASDRLVWNHGGATRRIGRPRFAHSINVISPAWSYFSGALHAIRTSDPGAQAVSLLHGATGFGREVAAGAAVTAEGLGLRVQAMEFRPGGAAAAADALAPGDVLLVAGAFEDEVAAGKVLLRRPWRAAAFVGAGVDEVLAPLGAGREGLLGPSQWVASVAGEPEEGPDAGWFVEAYRRSAGGDPPYPAAAAFAAGVLCARCLRDARDADDAAVGDAARRLSARTLFGGFRLDPETGLQVGHEVLTVQWQDGARRVVWPPDAAERQVRPFRR